MSRWRLRAGALAVATTALLAAGCGKKGPPLPPLVLLPIPPAELSAVRRGPQVDLSFRVPNANTDRSTPADLTRVELYASTAPAPLTADEVIKRAQRVGSLEVDKPKDPDEPQPKSPPPGAKSGSGPGVPPGPGPGSGLEQNAVATMSDAVPPDTGGPSYRTYVAVGINTRGRRGALSRIAVPLVAPPPAPGQPQVKYDEKAATVSWAPVPTAAGRAVTYSVYRPGVGKALTASPTVPPQFVDNALEWEKERCYEVRAGSTVESVRLESAASPSVCVTPHDTFAPAVPQGLVGVGSVGAISLIWTANTEADLAGYLVLRAIAPALELAPVTPSPVSDTNFRDVVPAGSQVTYAVQAVDKAGNRSVPSSRVSETAR